MGYFSKNNVRKVKFINLGLFFFLAIGMGWGLWEILLQILIINEYYKEMCIEVKKKKKHAHNLLGDLQEHVKLNERKKFTRAIS